MSLLLKALQQAERGPNGAPGGAELALEPLDEPLSPGVSVPPPAAKAAANLMIEKQADSEKRRLLLLLGTLAAVVVGMGVYFYLAVFMPWVFLPKPAPASAAQSPPPQTANLPSPTVTARADVAASLPAPLLAPVASTPASPAPAEPPRRTERNEPTLVPNAIGAKAEAPERAAGSVKSRRPASPGNDGIHVSSAAGTATPSGLQSAYRLLEEGRLAEARRAYENLQVQEARNADVFLGLALIAQRQGRTEDAAQLYLKALEADPKNAFAQASLSGMIARADPAAAETKLKALIAQQPAAFLYFRLGNLYAAQGRWHEAQRAYFEAQRLETDAPDYAFNLAVSLEHIDQPGAALDYYRRAIQLAQAKTAVFDPAQAQARIRALSEAK